MANSQNIYSKRKLEFEVIHLIRTKSVRNHRGKLQRSTNICRHIWLYKNTLMPNISAPWQTYMLQNSKNGGVYTLAVTECNWESRWQEPNLFGPGWIAFTPYGYAGNHIEHNQGTLKLKSTLYFKYWVTLITFDTDGCNVLEGLKVGLPHSNVTGSFPLYRRFLPLPLWCRTWASVYQDQ